MLPISPPIPHRKSVVAPWAQKPHVDGSHRSLPFKYYFLPYLFVSHLFSDLHPPTESAMRHPISGQASTLLKLLPHLAHLPFSSPDERAAAAPSRRAHRPYSSAGEQTAVLLTRRAPPPQRLLRRERRRPSASSGERAPCSSPSERSLRLLLLGYPAHCGGVDVGAVAGAGETAGDVNMGSRYMNFFIVVFVVNYCCKYIGDLL
jgi:hypothetical protein